jgi:hypothetical protein
LVKYSLIASNSGLISGFSISNLMLWPNSPINIEKETAAFKKL